MPLAAALLVAVKGLNGGIQIDVQPMKAQITQLPDALAQAAHQLHQAVGLVNAQAIHVAPIGAGRRKPVKLEKAAQQTIESNVGKMPQSVEANKQQHQYPGQHAPVTHDRTAAWGTIVFVNQLLELDQIQKLDQCQQPAKGAQLLPTGVVGGGSVDFTGSGAAVRKPFTVMRFGDRAKLLFNHLGDLPCVRMTLPKPL